MTKFVVNHKFPVIDRDEFLTPFDRMFDQIIQTQFPQIEKQVGVKPYQGTAYPKVNVYEYDDKVGVIAEIPGLDKKDLSGLTISTLNSTLIKQHLFSFFQLFLWLPQLYQPYKMLPHEAAFYMVGTIEEAIEKAEKMKKDAA